MTGRWSRWLLLFLLAGGAAARADDNSQVMLGHARFTVITPQLIRMEYAPAGQFVDDPSWFAVNREARWNDAKVTRAAGEIVIDTGVIRLTYHDDGKPFSAGNLAATVRRGEEHVDWHPGLANGGNLGGTARTLDGARGPFRLGDGLLSRDGWYVLDDSRSDLFAGDWVKQRPSTGNIDQYFFGYGDDFRAAFRSLTAIGGNVPMPRKYALGVWYSRYWPHSANEFKQIVQGYTDHGFPLDTIVMDMDWHLNRTPPNLQHKVDTWTGYTWDTRLIPDPPALLKWFHEQGLHVTLNDHPAEGVQAHEEMYTAFMKAMGADPSTGAALPFDAGDKHYLDTFYQFTHLPRDEEGVDFWWLDWQQYQKTRSIPDLDNLAVLNWYNYQRSSADGQRGQSFSRWAGWGDQRYPIAFSGDADTGFPMLGFEVPFTATAGNVGCFFWTHDIGGHTGGRNEESYGRWCQFGALTATLRSHSSRDGTTDRRPWNYPAWDEASMRVSFGLRSRLMPYLYTCMRESTADSFPFIRPMYLDRPTIETAYHQSQEFQFGDNLLVAPITSAGVGPQHVAMQAVWFPPESDWYDYFTGEKFAGGEHAVAVAPIDEFPLYVRAGVPLPMQPFTLRPGSATLDTLIVRCYPGADGVTGTSNVYEDDGVTTGYTHGQSATTPLSYVRHGDNVTITVGPSAGTYTGGPDRRGVIVELPCTQAGATSDAGSCTYDTATITTRIELPAAPVDSARTISVHVQSIPAEQLAAVAMAAHVQELTAADPSGPATSQPVGKNVLPDSATIAAAARGFAAMQLSQHPYGLGDWAVIYLHNHHAEADTLSLQIAGQSAQAVTLRSGDVIVLPTLSQGQSIPIEKEATLHGLPSEIGDLHTTVTDAMPATDDLALQATATASTGDAAKAIDGSILGYPEDQSHEWVTEREKAGAWIKLTWPTPTTIGHVLLFDRPNMDDHVLAGTLEFSDGSTISVGALPNDGRTPCGTAFAKKSVTWLRFKITRVENGSQNIGLAEIVVTNK
jgi:alpha-glucosidase (family GH31 glycosyl hydrolase)